MTHIPSPGQIGERLRDVCESGVSAFPPLTRRELCADAPADPGIRADTLPAGLEIIDQTEPVLARLPGIGESSTSVFSFNDGSVMVHKHFEPEDQVSEVNAINMPQWGTRVKGFNTRIAEQMAVNGIENDIIGTNQKPGTTMLHDAYAGLMILRQGDSDSSGEASREAKRSVLLGYSMGEMRALTMMGLAPLFEQNVILNLGMDPKAAEKIDITPKNAVEFGRFAVEELLELPKIVYDSAREAGVIQTVDRIRSLIPTISLHPTHLRRFGSNFETMRTGETGDNIDKLPLDAAVVIHFFKNSRLNHSQVYEEKMQNHPNARFVYEDGRHLQGANMRTLANYTRRATAAIGLIDQGAGREDLATALELPLAQKLTA